MKMIWKIRYIYRLKFQGTVLKVGDIVKFGRVPFKVKESSLHKINKIDSLNDLETLERNNTDIDSIDNGISEVKRQIVTSRVKSLE